MIKIIYFQFWTLRAYKFTIIKKKFLNERLHIQYSPYTWMCSSWVNPAYTCKYISQWYTIYSWSLALFQHSCMVWHPCICHITTLHVASRCILSLIYCSYKLFISYQHIQFYDTHASVLIIIDHHISFIFYH